ncbi:unnamed protein product [Cochlearia groenlandica]
MTVMDLLVSDLDEKESFSHNVVSMRTELKQIQAQLETSLVKSLLLASQNTYLWFVPSSNLHSTSFTSPSTFIYSDAVFVFVILPFVVVVVVCFVLFVVFVELSSASFSSSSFSSTSSSSSSWSSSSWICGNKCATDLLFDLEIF